MKLMKKHLFFYILYVHQILTNVAMVTADAATVATTQKEVTNVLVPRDTLSYTMAEPVEV